VVRVKLLGPVRVDDEDGTPMEVGGPRLRMLVAILGLHAGRPVSVDALVDGLWGAEPPADAANALQSLVSRLRRALGDPAAVESVNGGYRIAVDPEHVDATRFEQLVAQGRRDLRASRHPEAATVLSQALGLWRGAPLADVSDAPFAPAPAARLEDLRAGAVEDRFEAELALGRHTEILPDLETAGEEHPLRERLAALRMRALYAAGRQSEALAVYERVRATLSDELGVDPSAEIQQAHLAVLRGETTEQTVLAESVLPVQLTSFVGREHELARVAAALSAARLVTLVGPGGAGKTRLAAEAGLRDPAHERGRVWFVGLAAVRDSGDVVEAVLSALGAPDIQLLDPAHAPTIRSVDRIVELVNGGAALLVLDNCEHVVHAAAELAHELLARVPGLRVLTTSREPLAITGEVLCQVGPLQGAEAERLFTERAVAVRPDFTLDENTRDQVAEICRRLDGMPLALELAAARLRSMNVQQIARRLDDRFRLLTSGSRTALPRQRTLRAVVEWSWDLLEKPERVLARRLSVFPAGATVSAGEAICADELIAAEDVLYVLGSLVEKSIVEAAAGEGEPRYRMLETIRAYAGEQLDEAGERATLERRFAAYFVALGQEQEPLIRTGSQLAAIGVLEAEYGNLVTALRRAIDNGDSETAYRLVAALIWYWLVRGMHGPAVQFLGEVLDMSGAIPDRERAMLSVLHLLSRFMPEAPAAGEVRALLADCARTGALDVYPPLAVAAPMLALLVRDIELLERVLAHGLAHPDPWVRAAANWAQAFRYDDSAEVAAAEQARARALAGFTEVGDRWGQSRTLAMKAHSRSLVGDHAAVIAAVEQGLVLASELRTYDDMAQLRLRLVRENLRAGAAGEAQRQLHEARRLAVASGQTRVEAIVDLAELDLARQTGDLERAHELLAGLEAAAQRLELCPEMAQEWLGSARASLLLAERRAAEARQLLRTTVRASVLRRDMLDIAQQAELLAGLRHLEGDLEGAASALGLSAAIRGMFDRGNPELAGLITRIEDRIGHERFTEAYRRSAELSRTEALTRLLHALDLE
jgi:predicted ATPase/DNA-binding SARP family transcriptional activator